MIDEHTHSITVRVDEMRGPTQVTYSSVTVAGGADIEHYLDTFRAALVASGFATAVAMRLQLEDEQ